MQENNRLEFTSVLNDKLEKEIVSFLNNKVGGILYIGVNDFDQPVGVNDLDGTQLKIAERIQNNILPSTLGLFDVLVESIENVPVIKVIVSSGTEKPYYIKKNGMSPAGCFTRVGSSSQPMTTAMIDDLYSKRVHVTLRNISAPKQNLSFAQLKIYYEERGLYLNEHFSESLEFLTSENRYNYVAYLLADENGVSIKIAKYAGKDKSCLIENNEYGYCSLIKAANRVLEKLKVENNTRAKITESVRIEKNLVDPVALRESVINAIVHNDFTREVPPVFEIFSDRMEFTSYGGLQPGQSMDDFFSCSSMPRNRELMRVFKDVGLVEQLGSGMSRILRSYSKDIFKISDHYIRIVFPFEQWETGDVSNQDAMVKSDSLSELDQIVLECLMKDQYQTMQEIAKKTNKSIRTVARSLKKLRDCGKIVRIGTDRKGYWQINK